MNANHSRGLAGIAEHLQTYGRNGDTVLVHMTKGEVQGLQALAVAAGGTLTINPHTGLVEASFLKKMLPTLAGIALNFVPGVGPLLAAGMTAAVSTAASGSLKKGLMAGLQAYGGASLAGALAPAATAGSLASTATTALPEAATLATGAPVAAAAPLNPVGLVPTSAGLSGLAAAPPALAPVAAAPFANPALISTPASIVGPSAKTGLMSMLPQGVQNFGANFADAARTGIPEVAPGLVSKFAPQVAGMGVMSTASELMKPKELRVGDPEPSNYSGPYVMNDRQVSYPEAGSPTGTFGSSREHLYFSPTNTGVRPMTPEERTSFGYPSYRPPTPTKGKDTSRLRYAAGGETLEDGAFIMDARTVSELGNGSSGAGQDRLKKIGGKPIKGRGDGTSDSIRAKMGGKEARVARDEVKIPAKAVKKLGRGNHSRGANKLYDLMDKAKHARSTAERGQDSGLASLFGA